MVHTLLYPIKALYCFVASHILCFVTFNYTFITDTIPSCFLVVLSVVCKARNITSEAAEHKFGILRQMIDSFSAADFAHLIEKDERRLNIMFKNNLVPGRGSAKGYLETYHDYITSNMKPSSASSGPVVIDDASKEGVAQQSWAEVEPLISSATNAVKGILQSLGVDDADMSPFC